MNLCFSEEGDIIKNKSKKYIILGRNGFFYDGRKCTLEELGKPFGLTRERVRQIESRALQKIRKNDMIMNFVSYMDDPKKAEERVRPSVRNIYSKKMKKNHNND